MKNKKSLVINVPNGTKDSSTDLDQNGGPHSPTTPGSSTRRRRHSSYVSEHDENKERGNWSGKLDFILSCLSYAVGLGNVWRYPYKCYENGGGAFVLPFIIMMGLIGVPLFLLESAFGQYAGCGIVNIWRASPLFTGIGYGMFLVSFFVSIYYNVIMSWTFFYLFASFKAELPWSTCGNSWNTDACQVREGSSESKCLQANGTWLNSTCVYPYSVYDNGYQGNLSVDYSVHSNNTNISKGISPSDEFFHNYVLDISKGFEDMGAPRWQLVLTLLLSWALVCVCMIKGIKTSGRAVYFTSTFPYLVLFILLIRGLTLPGSVNGILYYITPRWNKLLDAKVWADAAVQIFFSLAPGWGGLITLSSYNKFKNNCIRDTYIVAIGDAVTSLFAGLVIFAIIGYMAHVLSADVTEVMAQGPGLAFIVYPEVVTRLPISPLWAILFFLMLLTLGLGTQFAIVNTVHTTLVDIFPKFFHKGFRRSFLMCFLCIFCFILGLGCVSRGGMYMLTLLDNYSATYSVLVIALTECVVLAWVYGYDRLVGDIRKMTDQTISKYYMVMWRFVSPASIIGILIFTFIKFKRSNYGDYTFPVWADALGFCVSLLPISMIPGVAIYKIVTCKEDLPLFEKIKFLSRSSKDWGPAIPVVELAKQARKQRLSSLRQSENDAARPLKQEPDFDKTDDNVFTTDKV